MQERRGGDRRLEHGRPARRWRGPYCVSAALQAGRRRADGRAAAYPACRGQGLLRRAAGSGHRRRNAQAGRRCRRSCFSPIRGTTLRGGRAPRGRGGRSAPLAAGGGENCRRGGFQIGRAACRGRGENSGGGGSLKKKKKDIESRRRRQRKKQKETTQTEHRLKRKRRSCR